MDEFGRLRMPRRPRRKRSGRPKRLTLSIRILDAEALQKLQDAAPALAPRFLVESKRLIAFVWCF